MAFHLEHRSLNSTSLDILKANRKHLQQLYVLFVHFFEHMLWLWENNVRIYINYANNTALVVGNVFSVYWISMTTDVYIIIFLSKRGSVWDVRLVSLLQKCIRSIISFVFDVLHATVRCICSLFYSYTSRKYANAISKMMKYIKNCLLQVVKFKYLLALFIYSILF